LLKHISYSYLHILACPYAAFLRYDAAIKGPTTPWLALGNALHFALELGHSEDLSEALDPQRTAWNFDVALALFKNEFQRIIDDEQVSIGWPQIKKMEAEGIEMLGGYNEQVLNGTIAPEPLALEKEFTIPFMGTEIIGRIDKVEYDDGYIITDFKSGQKEPTAWFLRHNLQLTAYAWACLIIYGELPKKLVWHHLRTGKLLETVRTEDDILDLKRMIENAIKMNEQGIRHRIFHEQVCGQCDYAGATCDDHELEEQVVTKLAAGERPDPSIVYRSRGW
jgi:hypothetical protein